MKMELEKLRARFHQTKTEKEKELIKDEMRKILERNPDDFATSMTEMAKDIADKTDEFLIKEKLVEVSKIVSMSYIAKNYFNKSRAWLHQRINGNFVNGKQATFSQEERENLNFAFKDLAQKIGSVSI